MKKKINITKKNYIEQNEEIQDELQKEIFDDNKKLSIFLGLKTKKDKKKWLYDNATNSIPDNTGVKMGLNDDPLLGNNKNSGNNKSINKSTDNNGVNKMTSEFDEAIRKNKESEAILDTNKTMVDLRNMMTSMKGQITDMDKKVGDSEQKTIAANKLVMSKFDKMENKVDGVCEDNKCTAGELQKLNIFVKDIDKKICTGNECNITEFKKIKDTVGDINNVICTDGKCAIDNFGNTEKKLNTIIDSVSRLEEEIDKQECPKCGKKVLTEFETFICPECDTPIKWDKNSDEEDDNDNEYP